jgi:hypothetical protein
MVDRIHHHASHVRSLSFPPAPTRFSYTDILMIEISNLPNRRHTGPQDSPHLTGLQPHLHIVTFASHNLSKGTGASSELSSFANP